MRAPPAVSPRPLTPQVVRCLLINPFPESALNEEAGKLFMEDYDAYFKKARMLTEVHALVASKKGEASGSSGELLAETSAGGPVEKKQKPVNSEKREKEKKKSLKRFEQGGSAVGCVRTPESIPPWRGRATAASDDDLDACGDWPHNSNTDS